MLRFFLLILAILIVLSLLGYAISLVFKLQKQKKQIQQAKNARYQKVAESIEIITQAMLAEQCDFSEGVLRLKPLLDVLGLKLARYPAMWALYETVMDMPILDERKNLKRNERMKLDLTREAKEAELSELIKAECHKLLIEIQQFRKDL